MEESREFVQSLERGLKVLQSFGADQPRLTFSAVAARTDLTRATARRFLLTLVQLKMVGTDGKLFWLLPRVLDIGFQYLSSLPWWQTAQPIIEDVSKAIGEICSISVLDETEIVYVGRNAVQRILSANISVGSRFPAYCTAMGKAMLAHLPAEDLDSYFARADLVKRTPKTNADEAKLRLELATVRRQGYAVSDQELEINLIGVAVPLLDRTGRAAGALGASALAVGEPKTALVKRCLPKLQDGARWITQAIRSQDY
jgi:IclR family transcriptional regulator, pca regulon regulatory protein